jgi:uncharacterized OB-fold protein
MSNKVSYTDLPPDTVIVCPSCGAKNMRTDDMCNRCDAPLDKAKLALTKGRGKLVHEVIQRHPELKEKILERLRVLSLPEDGFPVAGDALYDISSWDEKATLAGNLEKAGNFDESARQYEDLGLWAEAGRVRSRSNLLVREKVVVEREIVLVKCGYCGSLNPQGTLKCSSCGGRV